MGGLRQDDELRSDMPTHLRRRLRVLLLVVMVPPLGAQDAQALGKVLHAEGRAWMQEGRTVGLVMGVLAGGERAVIGLGKVGAGRKDAPDGKTIFEIGSITKVYTGVLLASLVEAEEVRLDTPVTDLLPEGAAMPRHDDGALTLLELATHTSGLPRLPPYTPPDLKDPYAGLDEEVLLESLGKLASKPAEPRSYAYSNLGFGLLGHVLSRKAAKPYEQLVRERIAQPLDLVDTAITLTPEQGERLAPGHRAPGAPAGGWEFDAMAGCGALRSTAEDLLRFLEAALEPPDTPFGRALRASLQRHAARGENAAMGLGWHLDPLGPEGPTMVWHNGGTGGYATFAGCIRDRRVAVVVLSNTTRRVDPLAVRLLRRLTR